MMSSSVTKLCTLPSEVSLKCVPKDEDLINMMILETAEASNVLSGWYRLCDAEEKGVNLSEAGAGRILRSLREKAY